jgi:Flp pilus assembly protein TadD
MFPQNRTSIPLLGFLIICSVAFMCGCAGNAAAKKALVYSENPADEAFDKGANQPPSIRTLYTMADILITQGRDDQAQVVLTNIIREHPDFTPAYNTLAELKMRQHRIDEAIKTLSAGLENDPRDSVLLNNMGMCWMVKRKYDKALDYFTRAAGVNPQNSRYRANMAACLAFLGRDAEAEALYRQVLSEKDARRNLEIIQAARRKQIQHLTVNH